MNPLLTAALDYASYGWRVVPLHSVTDGVCSCGRQCAKSAGKHPRLSKWAEIATTDQAILNEWWRQWPGGNVGVALGVSSGIVAVDIDTEDGSKLLLAMAGGHPPETLEYTTGNGSRLLFKIPDGSFVKAHPPKTRVLEIDGSEAIRLQSDGGQCVMPPSSHYSGRSYQWVQGRGPGDCELATMPEWLIAEMCMPDQPDWSSSSQRATNELLPGADYNKRGTWDDVLQPHGWKRGGSCGEKQYWTRPGKSGGVSATVGHYRATDGTPALFVFTGNAAPLKAMKCYDRFGAYTALNHGGSFGEAAKALAAKGFGEQRGHPNKTNGSSSTTASRAATAAASESANSQVVWAKPLPLTSNAGVPSAFPIETLPLWIAQYAKSVAKITNVPLDYPATYILAMAAGAIGSTLCLELTPTWRELPNLYAAVIAPKSSGKSPALKAVQHPLRKIQAQRFHNSIDKDSGVVPLYTTNTTVEGLVPQLKKHNRGMLVIADELSGWIGAFDQYKPSGTGSDRQFWLTNWSGGDHAVLRKNPEAPCVYISDPCVSIVGGIQPSVLSEIAKGRDDGLIERFLLAYPDPLPPGNISRAQYDASDEWNKTIELLADRRMPYDVNIQKPMVVHLSDKAQQRFDDWHDQTAEYCRAHEKLTGYRQKLNSYAGRLALILHAIEHLEGNTVGEDLNGSTMESAIVLTKHYLTHAERVFGERTTNPGLDKARVIHNWLINNPGITEFTRRQAHHATCKHWTSSSDLAEPLRLLVDYGYLQIAPTQRRDSVRYAVSPVIGNPSVEQSLPTIEQLLTNCRPSVAQVSPVGIAT